MATTQDERGLLNNFAKEPKVYQAAEPTPQQQRFYLLTGTLSALLVVGVVAIIYLLLFTFFSYVNKCNSNI